MSESRLRSFAKAGSWRLVGSILTSILVYLATQNLSLSVGIGLVETVVKIAVYYGHERVWGRISWGVATGKEIPVPVEAYRSQFLGNRLWMGIKQSLRFV